MAAIFGATWWFGEQAVKACWEAWARGSNDKAGLMDAVEAGAVVTEMDPEVRSVGAGGYPNRSGEIELDAAIMEGETMRCGAVCSVRRFAPVITLARRVMERTPHLMLSAEGAERFALQQGFEPRQLHSAASLQAWYEWRERQTEMKEASLEGHDTIGVLGWSEGRSVAACTTSGMAWKMAGRVGDSPIVGAGLYADDEVGCAVGTGVGEEIWRYLLSFRAMEAMRAGSSAKEACEEAIRFMQSKGLPGHERQVALIAIRKDGDYGGATNHEKFTAWFCKDGQTSETTFEPVKP